MSIQVRYGEDAYPIARLISDRARALGLTRSNIARRLGYADIGKAHQVLATALTTGIVPPHMAKHLPAALQVDDRLLAAVLETTASQRRDEARAQVLVSEAAYRVSFANRNRSNQTGTAVYRRIDRGRSSPPRPVKSFGARTRSGTEIRNGIAGIPQRFAGHRKKRLTDTPTLILRGHE